MVAKIKFFKGKMIILLTFLLLLTAFILSSLNVLTVKSYHESTDKLKGKVKLAVISDLHSSLYGKNQRKLLSLLDKQRPDLILMTGDVIDDKRSTENARIFFEGVKKICPAYYVYGNHELKGDYVLYKQILDENGVVLLNGEFDEIYIRGEKITVCGMYDTLDKAPSKKWQTDLAMIDEQTDDESYKILLSHRPHLFPYYNNANFDLVLCGHEHGGQFRLFSKGLYAPDEGLFPKYSYGEFKTKKGSMIVSSGLCKNAYPRFLNPPEVVIVNVN